MKKTTKIVTLIISAILLIGAVVGITASADNDPTVAIKYKNLAYEGAIQVLYAVEAENLPEGAKVQMYFYDAEPAEDSAPAYVKDEYTDEALIIGGKTYHAFFSKGIAPKNMRKSIFAVPVIVNGDAVVAKGECVEYSIYTYATNMLSKSPTAEQKELYTNLLDYGAATQAVLLDSGDYTAEELAAAGGYADQYCGIRLDVMTNGAAGPVIEKGAVTYYRPGTEVDFSTPLYKDEYSFIGYIDGDMNSIGDYGTQASIIAIEPGVYAYTAKYLVLEADAMDKTATQGAHNYTISDSKYAFSTLENEESTNNVLKINHPASTANGTVNFLFHSSGEAYIFETDVKWLGSSVDRSGNNWIARWGFVSDGSRVLSDADQYVYCNYLTTRKDTPLYFTGGTADFSTAAPASYQGMAETDKWHRVRFEYVPVGQNNGLYFGIQRFYIDGQLTEEKLVSSKGDNSKILYFRIGNRGKWDTMEWNMMLDNMVCYTAKADYYGQGLYSNHAGVNTYDGDKVNYSAGTVVADSNGNKVLNLTGKVAATPTIDFKADGYEYGTTYVFDTDIRWVSMTYSSYIRNWLGRIGFTSSATHTKGGGSDDGYMVRSYFGATPHQGMILSDRYDGTYGEDIIKTKPIFTPGVWYNFRVEYTITGMDAEGNYLGVEKTYVNNVLVSTKDDVSAYDNRGLYSYRMSFLVNTADSAVQYDNTFIGAIGEPVYRDATFEDLLTTSGYFKASSTDGEAISEYTVVDNPKGDGKVLKGILSPDDPETKEIDQEVNTISTMNVNDAKATGTYELSLDMLFDSTTLPKNNTVIQQFVVTNSKGYTALFTLKHTSGGNVNVNSDVDGAKQDDGVTPNAGKGGTLGTVKLLDGEWHNLRFVMYTNGTDSVYALYVDGALSGIGNYYHGIKACVINRVVTVDTRYRIKPFAPQDASVTTADLYLDNIGLRYVGDIPEDIPDWDDAK